MPELFSDREILNGNPEEIYYTPHHHCPSCIVTLDQKLKSFLLLVTIVGFKKQKFYLILFNLVLCQKSSQTFIMSSRSHPHEQSTLFQLNKIYIKSVFVYKILW